MRAGTLRFFAAVVFSAASLPVSALYNRYGVPDSSEIRKSLRETWFEAPLDLVRDNRPELRTNNVGIQFQIRLEETDSSFNIFVAPHDNLAVDVYSDKGKETIKQDVYPGDARGSWVLVRDKRTGKPLRIRYYFSSDSDVYVQFSPGEKTAYADFIIFGGYAVRGVPVGLPFDRFYNASYAEVMEWTKDTLPWKYTDIHTNMYHASLQMAAVIRENIPNITYADDAMYNENGEPVFVSTGESRDINPDDAGRLSLSSAGFVKWIADGLIMPLAGSCLKRAPLVVPTVTYSDTSYQGILSNSYDLSFALDWTRNLASAVFSVNAGRTYKYGESGVDVTDEPFSAEMTENGIQNTVGYIKDTGYPVQVLKSLLYVLAVSHPTDCYFAAVKESDRRSPEVRMFNECAAFFPYFDEKGRFSCIVFRNGIEMPFEEFCNRFSGCFVHLVRVRASDRFFPQRVELETAE